MRNLSGNDNINFSIEVILDAAAASKYIETGFRSFLFVYTLMGSENVFNVVSSSQVGVAE